VDTLSQRYSSLLANFECHIELLMLLIAGFVDSHQTYFWQDSKVLINNFAICRSEEYYEDPLLFFPERYVAVAPTYAS
jgi:hypothetical protein